ncbi:hypothetical protein GQ457_03G007700 [Hibiscus cannabinus]
MIGENNDDLVRMSSSDESPKELDEVTKAPTNAKNKRKGKKTVEATSERGKRKKKSVVWDHFKEVEGDAYHAECIYCHQKISCASSNGTNAMKRHTSRCKKAPFNVDTKQTILDFESKTKCNADGTIETFSVPKLWHFDQDEIRKALARMVVVDELPFSFVEREGFRHFCKIAVPSFVPLSRATITRDCYTLFIEKRKKLKNYFSNLSSRVCLTTDTWTSGQNLSYMCLTAHFIDDDWKLRKMIINFCPIAGHSGELIGRAIEKCLLEWGLKRIMTITVDNASSNDLAIKYLKQILNLWDGSVLNAEFLHMRCAAHILNLVVKDGLKDVDISVVRVRAAVKYVRSSPARLQKFKACVEEEKINSKSLVCLDIETRWNSTFSMLKSALVFRKAFKNLKTKYLPYTKELRKIGGAPDDEDRDKIASFLPFLQMFYEATLSFSGSSMARQMKLKFDKYWKNVNNVNVLMFIALLLDPRHKLRYVEWIIRCSYDPSDSYDLCHRIKSTLASLFDFYASSHPSSTQTRSSSFNPYSSAHDGEGEIRKLKGTNLRKDYVTEIELNDTSETTTELDRYLGDKCVRDNDSFDILAWWSVQTNNYPILMSMARDILAIPVSTVASESAFSTGGRVLDSFRTSLTPRLVEALVCTQDWIRASHDPIMIEESLLALENMEEEMQDLTLEQPTIIIDETSEVPELFL